MMMSVSTCRQVGYDRMLSEGDPRSLVVVGSIYLSVMEEVIGRLIGFEGDLGAKWIQPLNWT